MLVQKPEWVAHSGPIFSIDVHPDGTRFATAGADHKVKVWSLLPLLDPPPGRCCRLRPPARHAPQTTLRL